MNRTTSKPNILPYRTIIRLILAVTVAVVVYYLMPGFSWEVRLILSFDLGLLVHLGLLWAVLWQATPEKTYRHAQGGEPSSAVLLFFVVLFSLSSLFAVALMLDDSKSN